MNSYLEELFVDMLNKHYPNLEYAREYEDIRIQNRIGKKVRYDFYFPKFDLIIEIDGIQHYKACRSSTELREIMRMDNKKEMIAKNYGYKFGRIRSIHKNNFLHMFEKILKKVTEK